MFIKDTNRLNIQGWKKTMQQQKRIGVATTNIKLDFNTKATREKQGHFIMVKGSGRYNNFMLMFT